MTRVFFLYSNEAKSFDSYSKAREFADDWCERHPGAEWMTDADGDLVIDHETTD